MGRERRTLRGVELHADRVAEIAHRPVAELRRRDVAIALLSVPAEDALASLPVIRRGLLAAGNPLSAPFWQSAEAILHKISEHDATFGDVHGWLEATGTEPTGIIGLHVWEEPSARSPLQEEMHARLVGYLEERLAAGEIDPDRLADRGQGRQAGVPGAAGAVDDHAAARRPGADDGPARRAGRGLPRGLGGGRRRGAQRAAVRARPGRRAPASRRRTSGRAAARLRADIARPGWPGQMLVSFSGRTADALPDDDAELWLTLATSVASPQGDPLSEEDREFARAMEWAEDEDLKFGHDLDEPGADSEPDELSAAIAAVCALDHFDWLAVMSALVTGGPGTPASAADLARYVRDFDPDEVIGLKVAAAGDAVRDEDEDDGVRRPGHRRRRPDDYEDDFDELSIEGLFLHVTAMWSVLGAID